MGVASRYLPFQLALLLNLAVQAQDVNQPDIKLSNIVRNYSDLQPFNNPAGIFLDSRKNEIYLADSGNHQVSVFDMRGNTLMTFKHWVTDEATGERILGNPRSVVVLSQGDIIVSDSRSDDLDVFGFRGDYVMTISPQDFDNLESLRAAELAADGDDNIYIATTIRNCEIIKLDSDYNFLMRFGKSGKEPDEFDSISGIWVDDDGKIYVCDIFAVPVIKIFSPEGKYLRGFGGHSVERLDFSFPSDIVVTRGGRIWVGDSIRQVVKCLGQDGQFITMIGGFGGKPGDMRYPSAMASDGDTLLIVAEKNGNRYQQFIIK